MQDNDDPKIAQNIAVTEFFLRGCTDPSELLGSLTSIRCERP